MPRDFKQFVKENKSTLEENKDKAEDYQKIIDKYKNMDQNGLMSSLFQEASKLKSEGKLNSQTLNSLKTTLTPFLNEQQKEMLNQLVTAIDEQK